MAKKERGVKHLGKGVYLLDLQVGGARQQVRFHAETLKKAKDERDRLIVVARQKVPLVQDTHGRLKAGFAEAWLSLEQDLLADGVCRKNYLRNKLTFKRIFTDFRDLRYPTMTSVSQVTVPFLKEYKAYFVNDLGHNPKGGLKAEFVCIRAMLRRLKSLGYCGKDVVEAMAEIPIPSGEKKQYPNISKEKIKALVDYIRKDRPDYFALIYYVARTGRRINESSLIERRDCVWDGLRPVRINVRAETTKMKRDAPLTRIDDDLAKVIQESYRRGSGFKTRFLFCNRLGKKCQQSCLLKYLNKAAEVVLGVKISLHYFRHRLLTHAGLSRLSMVDVMSIANIKNERVLQQYYAHATPEGQDMVLDATRI